MRRSARFSKIADQGTPLRPLPHRYQPWMLQHDPVAAAPFADEQVLAGRDAEVGLLRVCHALAGDQCRALRSATHSWRESSGGETTMTMLKVLEVLAQSDKSWEDAAQNAVTEAGKTVRGIKSVYLKELEATVENGKIAQYRVNAKISFLLEGS